MTAAAAALSPREALTRRQLEAPIAVTLAAMTLPNLGEGLARIAFITFDAVFVGWLGTDALAGLGLVLPFFFLLQMLSAGGLGVGVASAIARALGAGRREDAHALVLHGVIVGGGFGLVFSGAMLLFGEPIYRAMGASGGALDAAVTYSAVVFLGGPAISICNTLANAVRGTGRMSLSAGVIVVGEAFHLALSPLLILGYGPIPALGLQGAACAALAPYVFGCLVLGIHLLGGQGIVRLSWSAFRMPLFADILRVGLMASVNTLQMQAVGVLLTALIGRFGAAALAGYTVALRLEMSQIPVVFAVGAALVAMVGTNAGAGRLDRAKRIAWIGVGFAGAISLIFAVVGVLFAESWMRAFTADPEVIAAGALYLLFAAPVFPLFGIGLGVYFAAQGAGRVWWAFAASISRGIVTLCIGWLAVLVFGGGYEAVLWSVAAGIACFGVIALLALRFERWG